MNFRPPILHVIIMLLYSLDLSNISKRHVSCSVYSHPPLPTQFTKLTCMLKVAYFPFEELLLFMWRHTVWQSRRTGISSHRYSFPLQAY